MKKQNFLKASLILMVSAAFTKILGAMFKIPLTNVLGGVGMSYFSCAYSLFLPIYALVVTGLSAAVARLTAQSVALELYDNAKKIRRTALKIFTLTGLLGSFAIALPAQLFASNVAKTPDAWLAVTLIAPSVIFGCITSVERGYHEGMSNMYPTALSQLVEGLVKLFAGIYLCTLVTNNPDWVMRHFPTLSIKAVAAAAGVLGVTLGSAAAALYFPIIRIFTKKNSVKGDLTLIKTKDITRELLIIAIPIGLSSVVTNLTALIDMGTLINCIEKYNGTYILPGNVYLTELPQFVYGSFAGIALTVFNLVPSVTNMLGKGILPSVTSAWERKDRKALEENSSQALITAAVLATPAAIGLGFLAEPILTLLFRNQPHEVVICVTALRWLMPGMVCLCISFPVFSMLQAIGKASVPLKIMLIGAAVKLGGNLYLIPKMGVDGSAISTSLCYAFILAASLRSYIKYTGINVKLSPFLKISHAAAIGIMIVFLLRNC